VILEYEGVQPDDSSSIQELLKSQSDLKLRLSEGIQESKEQLEQARRARAEEELREREAQVLAEAEELRKQNKLDEALQKVSSGLFSN